jgi:hypothetical protein
VNASTDETSSPSCRYWKAAIATLPPTKRDAAWEFYAARLADGQAGDTLAAMVLLLEANGAFLLTLPEQFHQELIHPLRAQVAELRDELQSHTERQQKTLIEQDKVQEGVSAAAALIERTNRDVVGSVKGAIDALDIADLASRINRSLESNTLRPMQIALQNLRTHVENADGASLAAERSIRSWRRAHIGGIVGACSLASLLLAGVLLSWGWWKMEDHYRQRLGAQVVRLSATDNAYRQLLWLGISLRLEPWVDQSGKIVEGGYCVVIDDAEDASLKVVGDRKAGVVTLKATPLVKRREMLQHQVEKLTK